MLPKTDTEVERFIEHYWLNLGDINKLELKSPFEMTPAQAADPARYFMRAMMDPHFFYFTAKHLLGMTLAPFQLVCLKEMWNHAFPMIIGSRGMSKTTMLAIYSILKAVLCQGTKIVVCGTGLRQSRLVFDSMRKIWDGSDMLRDLFRGERNGPHTHIDKLEFLFGDSDVVLIPIGCLSIDALLTTQNGIRNIELLRDGHGEVWGNGQFRKIGFFYDSGKTCSINVKTKRGYKFTATPNHKMKVVENCKIIWKRTDELKSGDKILIDRTPRWFTPSFECTQDEAYCLGLMIGDGNYTNKYLMRYTTIDKELVNSLLNGIGDFKPESDNLHYNMCGKKKCQDWLDFWGLKRLKAPQKYLPQTILSASKENMARCLSGLFDTDGHVFVADCKGGGSTIAVCYTTTSEKLAYQIQYILLHYGIICSISYRDRLSCRTGNECYRCYELRINGEDVQKFKDQIGFKLNRKIKRLDDALFAKKRCYSINSNLIPVDKLKLLEISEKYELKKQFTRSQILIRKNITDNYLRQFIKRCKEKFVPLCEYEDLIELINPNIYIESISKIETGLVQPMVDINIPQGNEYCANGFFSHNTGEKVRGLRAHVLLVDEFSYHNPEIFEIVLSGFTAVSQSPIESAKYVGRMKAMKALGIPIGERKQHSSNQSILTGTASYSFNHFCEYWRKWKSIIESKGNASKLEEIFQGDVPLNFDYRDYSIIRMPIELLVEGFMDAKSVAKFKISMHSAAYQMEYSSIFSADSQGFFKRTLLETCIAREISPVDVQGTKVTFLPKLSGNKNLQYVFGIDPASEKDRFTILILELCEGHRRIVYCWSTIRSEFKAKLKQGMEAPNDFYQYCARKIRDLMKLFPCARIIMDAQGGGYGVEEALQNKSTLIFDETPIYQIVENDKEKPTDQENGLHILELAQFARAEWVSLANTGMRKDFEDKVLLFPDYDAAILGLAQMEDEIKNKSYDTMEDCILEIEELKDELTSIVHTQTGTQMRDRWDVPEVKLPGNKKGRQRKDKYSALLMANMAGRTIQNYKPTAFGEFYGARVSEELPKKGGKMWASAPDWFLEKGSPMPGVVLVPQTGLDFLDGDNRYFGV